MNFFSLTVSALIQTSAMGVLCSVVCYTGEIEDVQIARGLNMETDAVCLEFIKNMPNWIPAQDVKRPVDSRVRLPITFNLN